MMESPPMLPNQPTPFTPQNPPPPGKFEEARRIEVRPRAAGSSRAHEGSEGDEATGDVVLHFSCPACLHMLAATKQAVTISVKCPECSAWVMPPQLINTVTPGKTSLPPPRKTGTNPLKS
jgi:hypothetical protein